MVVDTDWLERLHRGEEWAYRTFFDQYYQILALFAMKYVRQRETAEDVVNDVIVSMYRKRPRFDSVVALKSYLYLSVRNSCLNILRNGKAQSRYAEVAGEAAGEQFFLDRIIEEEVYFLLENAIAGLPEMPRRVYELSLQDLSNEEIARQLSLTVDSVKAYKKRGEQILKERLKGLMSILSVPL